MRGERNEAINEYIINNHDGRLVIQNTAGGIEYDGGPCGCRVEDAVPFPKLRICAVLLNCDEAKAAPLLQSNGIGVDYSGNLKWSVDLSSFFHEDPDTQYFNSLEPSSELDAVFFYTPYGYYYEIRPSDGQIISRGFAK